MTRVPGPPARPRARAQAAAPGASACSIFFSPNGTVSPLLAPDGRGRELQLRTRLRSSSRSPPQQARLLILDGIDFKNVSNHEPGMDAMLTGGGADTPTQGQSVDQYIAGRLPAETPFASLELGVGTDAWGGSTQTRMLYAPGHTFVHPDQDPVSVYKRLFGAPDASPEQLDARPAQEAERARPAARRARATCATRSAPRSTHKLDAHLDALRRVETA